ncbi:hypothetical protein TNCV_1424151 [Trichonephila clavipes]|nr:hypothetical protein TNCV_1424151 [Trichonephila clavipes]
MLYLFHAKFAIFASNVVPYIMMAIQWKLDECLLAFSDDIDIIARTSTALRQAFLSLEKESFRMGDDDDCEF